MAGDRTGLGYKEMFPKSDSAGPGALRGDPVPRTAGPRRHPDSVLVCLTEMNGSAFYPDGRTEYLVAPAGVATFLTATTHLMEN
jgi:hypothetical protein